MDTLSRRLCTIAIMANAIYIAMIYFTRSFFMSLGTGENLGEKANTYFPNITNKYFYDILSSTSITLELILIVTITLMLSLAFIRQYKNKDKRATIYSIIMLIFIGITDITIYLGFSLLKGKETFAAMGIKSLMPIKTAIGYTILVSLLYLISTLITKNKTKNKEQTQEKSPK